MLVPFAIPGWWGPKGLQCCSHDAVKQNGNMRRASLSVLVTLMLLSLPAMLHSQQQQPEACACKPTQTASQGQTDNNNAVHCFAPYGGLSFVWQRRMYLIKVPLAAIK